VPDEQSAAPRESLDLRAYVDVLVRRRRVVLVVAVTSVLLALAISLQQDKQYTADAQLLVGQQSADTALIDANAAYVQAVNASRALNNEVEALKSGITRDAVDEAYDGPLDPDDVDVKVASDTADVATVSITGSDPDEVARLVNLYVEVATRQRREERTNTYAEQSREIQQQVDDLAGRIAEVRQPLTDVEAQLAGNPGDPVLQARQEDLTRSLASQLNPLQAQKSAYEAQLENLQVAAGILQTGGWRVLTEAEVPTDPVSPKPVQSAVIALVVGLMLGVVLAYLRDNLDERLRGIDDLNRAAPGLPLLTMVPERRDLTRGFVAMRDDPTSLIAEAFRSLRTSVKFAALDRPIGVIQVTSATPGEGKTTAVANLAEALAQGGERVAVLCCDLRRPNIHVSFGEPPAPGFTDVLVGSATLTTAVRHIHDRLYLLPAGSPPPNPSELLSSSRANAVIEALVQEFDVVLIDSTPVLPVTDALVVSRLADAILVVVDARTTKRKVLRQALERLEQVSAPVLGLVLRGGTGAAYDYGYAYEYGEQSPSAQVAAPQPADARR
jgi:capsular exopolysaccharide synthesis family protein